MSGFVTGKIVSQKHKDGKGSSDTLLTVATTLAITAEELQYWTNITCLYDKHWTYDPNYCTVPVCFLSILNVVESISADTAKQRLIMYEAPAKNGSQNFPKGMTAQHPAYSNNIRAVIDNVVVQPKVFKIDCLVADNLIGPYEKQGLYRLLAMIEFLMTSNGASEDTTATMDGVFGAIQQSVSMIQTLISTFDTVFSGLTSTSTESATMNKNSLMAMAQAGHLICFLS